VHRDPQYLDEAGRLKVDISPIGGDEVLAAITRIASAPPDLLARLEKLLGENKSGGRPDPSRRNGLPTAPETRYALRQTGSTEFRS
jgi:hypothetical protein